MLTKLRNIEKEMALIIETWRGKKGKPIADFLELRRMRDRKIYIRLEKERNKLVKKLKKPFKVKKDLFEEAQEIFNS